MIIALLGLIAYSNTFGVPFQFDDKPNIVENPIIKDLRYFLDTEKAKKYIDPNEYPDLKKRYIGHLTFALNYKVSGLDIRGYHAVNLLIHILNGVLLYLLVMLIFKTPFMEDSLLKENSGFIALLSAILFVSHPVQTQAVTYIVQRLSSLATMFYLLSLVLYVKFRLRSSNYASRLMARKGYFGSVLLYVLSLVSAVLAMKTKEISFTLPLVIVLFEFLFFTGKASSRLLRLIPLLLTLLIIPLTYVGLYSDMDKSFEEIMADADAATTLKRIPRVDYLLTQFRVIVTYLRLLALPAGQNLDYDYPAYHSFFAPPVVLSFLFLLGLICLGVYLIYRSRMGDRAFRLISFGIFWFFITISVESSIVPLYRIFEHRVYLPSAGFFAAIVTVMFLLIKNQKAKKAAAGAFVLILIVLISATYARNAVWQNEISLWSDVVQKSPDNARGHNNLGTAYDDEGMYDKAMEQFKTAIRLLPDYAEAHNNLGAVLEIKGMKEDAIKNYRTAIELKPDYLEAHNNLGTIYYETGQENKALEHYRMALEINPYHAEANYNLANVYQTGGLTDKAIGHYRAALKSNQDFDEAHNNLAVAYISKGLNRMAIEHLQISLVLNPNNAEAHFNLGIAYINKGFTEKARSEFEAALKLRPGYRRAKEHLDRLSTLP
jgi:tetratricopeptide (TPR) repeat protein